jgi:hypothetical protein
MPSSGSFALATMQMSPSTSNDSTSTPPPLTTTMSRGEMDIWEDSSDDDLEDTVPPLAAPALNNDIVRAVVFCKEFYDNINGQCTGSSEKNQGNQ